MILSCFQLEIESLLPLIDVHLEALKTNRKCPGPARYRSSRNEPDAVLLGAN